MGETQLKHGNYHHYYRFRAEDTRSNILRQHLQTLWNGNKLQLKRDRVSLVQMADFGCNSGEFTAKVRDILEQVSGGVPVRAVGVDIDDELCHRASAAFPDIEFISGNLLNIACQEMPPNDDPIERYMVSASIDQFDVICCFSVLMYIHLNGGDEGLRRVLDYLCGKTKLLILELQSWSKYRDQVRRLKRGAEQSYPLYEGLQWRGNSGVLENHITNYVLSRGFEMVSESDEKTEFHRGLLFFQAK
ncbi:probable RNA methyltransferase CG11342 [Anopheles marshallii]|uniref:probable RNA methyltransferase CG11342 n=1 Tax=Anopheles marshallii TaxID=1521116 RepID=UPI00237A30B7|nr:probable RNA methyltransferase CG11342 [Anopheles marshallii]